MVDMTRKTAVAADLLDLIEARSQICYRLTREKRDALHRLALDRHTNVQGLLDEAIGDLLSKHRADI
ncbi:MAG: hypothetical protein KKF33_00490 [Alphaproteobacteria bacterium]|jgi:hypothetical protein|nr:hypothetical protein [Alphaproteobacteria bacterium]